MKLIDFHCDTISKIHENPSKGNLKDNEHHVSIDKLIKSNSLAQFFALYVNAKTHNSCYEYGKELLNSFNDQINENKTLISLGTNYASIIKNEQTNKITAFLTLEEGGILEGSLDNFFEFYKAGVRLITLTWNYPNEIGYPNANFTYKDQGLTKFGKELVEAMNHYNTIVDVSHLSDGGFFDVNEISKKPFIASHSNCRSITNHPRNLTDPMIRAIADKGGVIGINLASSFLGDSPKTRIDDILLHIDHMYKTGGKQVISLGCDFDGIDNALEIEDVSEMYKLREALSNHGYSYDMIENIFYKNALTFIKEVLN
ncbi:dipeptidase [Clostridium cellulovorans]|uniref:Membrane dipeptidase n=1 Tax=Clostridium cellulovorans (strain ATCC 35296 / DSM 3052 / OCM 3 / 743B) TaxID=573061 RepID=D9SL92_CLOC7|nr:dipeptidase [Clostridium cellulovorans]ADL51608.1 Membrane dipeptidase [Clostridium cellulovorans 743B]